MTAAASALHGASAAAPSPQDPAERLLLRLHDLPLGYRVSDGSPEFPIGGIECHSIEPSNPQPRLAAFLDRYSPAGCVGLYLRLFRIPGAQPAPLVAGNGALETDSVEAAEAGLAVSQELLSHLLGDELPEEVQPPTTIGNATRLFHWSHPGLFAPHDRSSSFLGWRSGNVVAAIFVSGGRAAANDRIAVELARLQQRHIEAPAPYTSTERDDTEVALEDPALEVPVYWLGRRFVAGHGLPLLRLAGTASTTLPSPRVPRANLFYSDRLNLNHAEGFNLNLWSPRQWKRLKASGSKLPASLRCGTTRRLKLPRGHALIYSGFEGTRGPCPKRRPRAYTARIYLGRVVVTAETMSICGVCFGAGTGPYNSLRGMKAAVRGLRLRPRPTH